MDTNKGMYLFRFNTGRLYTEKGQPIRVAYWPETGRAYFADEGRGIDGEVQCDPYLWGDERTIARQVLEAYDHLAYKTSMDTLCFLNNYPRFLAEHGDGRFQVIKEVK